MRITRRNLDISIPGCQEIREYGDFVVSSHIKCPQQVFYDVIQAMEECGNVESTLRNRAYFVSLGWETRNFSILIRAQGAGQKAGPVSSNKDSVTDQGA
jgi:hypothetical protein